MIDNDRYRFSTSINQFIVKCDSSINSFSKGVNTKEEKLLMSISFQPPSHTDLIRSLTPSVPVHTDVQRKFRYLSDITYASATLIQIDLKALVNTVNHTTIVIITSTLIVNPMNGGDPARDKNLM